MGFKISSLVPRADDFSAAMKVVKNRNLEAIVLNKDLRQQVEKVGVAVGLGFTGFIWFTRGYGWATAAGFACIYALSTLRMVINAKSEDRTAILSVQTEIKEMEKTTISPVVLQARSDNPGIEAFNLIWESLIKQSFFLSLFAGKTSEEKSHFMEKLKKIVDVFDKDYEACIKTIALYQAPDLSSLYKAIENFSSDQLSKSCTIVHFFERITNPKETENKEKTNQSEVTKDKLRFYLMTRIFSSKEKMASKKNEIYSWMNEILVACSEKYKAKLLSRHDLTKFNDRPISILKGWTEVRSVSSSSDHSNRVR